MGKYTYFDFMDDHRMGINGDEFLYWIKHYLVLNQLGINPESSNSHMKKILEEILARYSPWFRHELNEYRQNLVKQYKNEEMLKNTYSEIVGIFNSVTEGENND